MRDDYEMYVSKHHTDLPHSIIASPSTSSEDDCELRNFCTGNCGYQLGAVFCDSSLFCIGANHEATDILQEYQGYAPLGA